MPWSPCVLCPLRDHLGHWPSAEGHDFSVSWQAAGQWRQQLQSVRWPVAVMWGSCEVHSGHVSHVAFFFVLKAPPLASSTPIQRVEPTVVSCAKRPAPSVRVPESSNPPTSRPTAPQPPIITAKSKPQPKIILSTRNEPIGLNVADFLPVSPRFKQNWKNSDPGHRCLHKFVKYKSPIFMCARFFLSKYNNIL